jgi:hypothetical protein
MQKQVETGAAPRKQTLKNFLPVATFGQKRTLGRHKKPGAVAELSLFVLRVVTYLNIKEC